MSRSIRRLALPPIAAASLLLAVSGTALAEPAATVTVFHADGTPAAGTVCEFYFEFSPVEDGESGAWELRDSGGTAVANGSYSVTGSAGDREPNDGALSFPNGTYTLLWDDEPVIDRSNEELEIVVECEDEESPMPSASVEESFVPETDEPSFEQSFEGETDAPSFQQSQADDTDAPPTLPDTAASDPPARPDPGTWTGALLAMLGLVALVLVATPARRSIRR